MRSLIRAMLRIVYGHYVPEPVRNALLVQLMLLKHEGDVARSGPPRASRIAIVSPHFDDEVFGCGGTAALAARAGAAVTPVFLTDGSKGYPRGRFAGLDAAALRAAEAQVGQTRREESRRAGKILGLSDPVFLDLPETGLLPTPDAVAALAGVLRALAPEAVFLPFFTESNTDHWMTNVIFLAAARRAKLGRGVRCWGFEVWTPLPANTMVDVTEIMETKREAMAEFHSQNADYDYPRALAALNAYRSLITAKGGGFAEAFFVADLDVYRRLYDHIVIGEWGVPAA